MTTRIHRFFVHLGLAGALLEGCASDSVIAPGLPLTAGAAVGADHAGQYHLGPVDFAETRVPQRLRALPAAIQGMTGQHDRRRERHHRDAGLPLRRMHRSHDRSRSNRRAAGRHLRREQHDRAISISAPRPIRYLSEGEYPRAMSWHLVACDNGEPLYFQFQTDASQWWTSLWVRNPSMAIESVEVRSANHPTFTALTLGTDGTYTDGDGFGAGPFTLRVTGVTGATFEMDFPGVTGGALIAATGNLPLP